MRCFITQAIDPVGLSLLRDAGIAVDMRDTDRPITASELLQRSRGCAALIPMLTDRIGAELLARPELRVVANYAVGFDNIDIEAASAADVIVTNTPGVLTDATADLAFAGLLAAARRVLEGDALVRAGGFHGWHPTALCGLELSGARLGIVGLGRIGRAVAERARAFGMEVVSYSRSGGLPLDELLETSDVISLHCPLTPETRHLIDARALRRMKPTAILVNTARGPVVDEAALVQALRDGVIASAALDVFEQEPLVHPGLLKLPNVVLLPHLGSATSKARAKMSEMAARNVIAVLAGTEPPNRVN